MHGRRVALTFVFLADGVMVGSWAARIPAVKGGLDLTTSQLGLALFAMSLGALVSMPVAVVAIVTVATPAVPAAPLILPPAALLEARPYHSLECL